MPRLAFWSITIGVTASILVLSLANGLHNRYIQKLAEQEAHITVVSAGRGIPAYQQIIQTITAEKGVVSAFTFSQDEALLQIYGESAGLILKSYPEYFDTDNIFTNTYRLLEGEWSLNKPRTITIGEALAKNLAIFLGDSVNILVYDSDFGAVTYKFKVSGIFSAGDALLNTGVGFISAKDAEELFGQPGYVPYIGIRIKDFNRVEEYVQRLEAKIPFKLKSWRLANLNALLAIQNEKQIISVLLLTFFCVAFFGILAIITVLAADRREEIALLKTLGLTPKQNFLSFLWTGMLLGISASLAGVFFGVLISANFNHITKIIEYIINTFIYITELLTRQQFSRFSFLNQSVYYLNEFPILIKWQDIMTVCLAATLCSLSASVYPALLSKNLKPAEILRKRAG